MNHTVKLVMVAVLLFAFCACAASAADDLANGFAVPAESVRPWRYWWWLNGYVTKEGIVRDLDEMRAKGINGVLVFHHFIHQSEPDDQAPGYVWPGVGVEFNRKNTWWPLIHGWLSYMSRCHTLLQEGRFVADVCYFQGEWVPAYVPSRWAMNPPLPPGIDCDMINAEALVTRSAMGQQGRLVLPDGQSYRYLVLWQGGRWQRPPPQIFNRGSDPSTRATCHAADSAKPLALSPATLKKLKELVEGGVTLIGPRPDRAIGLAGYPTSDVEVKKLTDQLWGPESAPVGQRKVSKGRVIWGQSLAQVMHADGLRPDLEIVEDAAMAALPAQTLSGIPNPGSFDCIHRTLDDAEVYFIANLRDAEAAGKFTFRVDGKQPELWDPLTGAIRDAAAFQGAAGRTTVPLQFAPRGSLFVVFRKPIAADAAGNAKSNFPKPSVAQVITGVWTVRFDPKWGGPASVEFAQLGGLDETARARHQLLLGQGHLHEKVRRAGLLPAAGKAALARFGQGEERGRGPPQRQEFGRGVDSALASRTYGRGTAHREPAGNRCGQSVA